jgi:hypothetical protein
MSPFANSKTTPDFQHCIIFDSGATRSTTEIEADDFVLMGAYKSFNAMQS